MNKEDLVFAKLTGVLVLSHRRLLVNMIPELLEYGLIEYCSQYSLTGITKMTFLANILITVHNNTSVGYPRIIQTSESSGYIVVQTVTGSLCYTKIEEALDEYC